MAELIIEVVEGPDAGAQRRLEGDVEVGREADGLALHDELASRHHARFRVHSGSAFVEDLDSANGTLVNGEEIHAPTRLELGDVVVVGVNVLELRSAQQVAVQATALRPIPPPLAKPPARPDFVPGSVAKGVVAQPELDRLLDARVKSQARTAPIGVLVLVAFAVMIYLVVR